MAPDQPLPAVLDTACVRTGLHFQLRHGSPPKSVTAGALRVFMEYDTLTETVQRLPRFAKQMKVPESELRRAFDEDWLPRIRVVRLPAPVRTVDPRAVAVRARDADDLPAAALAAMLSPCLLLTHNYRDFGALGVVTTSQGIDGARAAVDLRAGEVRNQALMTLPVIPVQAVGAAAKWATQRFGAAGWMAAGLLAAGGIHLYRSRSPDKRDRIKRTASAIGTRFLELHHEVDAEMRRAGSQLGAAIVPAPDAPSTIAAVLRELAVAPDARSAQQLAEAIDPALRPPVRELRAYLREHDGTLFFQVRRGGFDLGRRYAPAEIRSGTATPRG